MFDDLKEFKEYYCKYRCEYKSREGILEKFETGVYCPICNDEYDSSVRVDIYPCEYCRIEDFINVFELENM